MLLCVSTRPPLVRTLSTLQDEYLVAVTRQTHLQPYEHKLKNFCYREALDAALSVGLASSCPSQPLDRVSLPPPPSVQAVPPSPNRKWYNAAIKEHTRLVYSLVQELARRDGLASAIAGRTEKELLPLVKFLEVNMLDPKFSPLFLSVCEMVVGKPATWSLVQLQPPTPFFLNVQQTSMAAHSLSPLP